MNIKFSTKFHSIYTTPEGGRHTKKIREKEINENNLQKLKIHNTEIEKKSSIDQIEPI